MWKAFLTPRWLGWHALLVVSVGALGWIGGWQWSKARADGDWQNYGYAVQWWLFAGFAVFLWVKLILDELYPERVTARETAPPVHADVRPQAVPPPPEDDEDDELAAYNRHLARLAEQAGE